MKLTIGILLACLIVGVVGAIIYSIPLGRVLFPPDDLYKPLWVTNWKNANTIYDGSVIHRYKGRYALALIVDRPPPVGVGYKNSETFAGTFELASDDEVLLTQELCDCMPFWGEDGSGIILKTYTVPKNVVLDQKVDVLVRFAGMDRSFVTQYEPSKLVIRKMSDK